MSVEKPLGAVLFTLVMKQVPWNEVLQSSQEMLQYIPQLYAVQAALRAWELLGNSRGQGKCYSRQDSGLLLLWVHNLDPHSNWLVLLSYSLLEANPQPATPLRMLLRKGPQKKVLHHNCSFKTKLTPLILIFSGNSELKTATHCRSV